MKWMIIGIGRMEKEKEKILQINIWCPESLETTMNLASRIMLRVGIEEVQKADKMVDFLMGSNAQPKRGFIQTHAKSVKNLDL